MICLIGHTRDTLLWVFAGYPLLQGDVHMAERGSVDHSREPLSGIVERVTFHSAETGFCVLRVKVRAP